MLSRNDWRGLPVIIVEPPTRSDQPAALPVARRWATLIPPPAITAGLWCAQKQPFAQIAIKNYNSSLPDEVNRDFVKLQGQRILQFCPLASIIPKTKNWF
jgi:hypothetical protein